MLMNRIARKAALLTRNFRVLGRQTIRNFTSVVNPEQTSQNPMKKSDPGLMRAPTPDELIDQMAELHAERSSEIDPASPDLESQLLQKRVYKQTWLEKTPILGPQLQKYDLHLRKFLLKSRPKFEDIPLDHVEGIVGYSQAGAVNTRFFWTPMIQKIRPDDEFLEFLDDHSFKAKKWSKAQSGLDIKYDAESNREIIEAFLWEGIKDTPFTMTKDFYCLPSKNCDLHGKVDYVLFNPSNEYNWPLVIVDVVKPMESMTGDVVFHFDSAVPFAVGKWFRTLGNVLKKNDKRFAEMVKSRGDWDHVRVIQTNGHFWKIYEFSISETKMRQTKWYQPRTIKEMLQNDGKESAGEDKDSFRDNNPNLKRVWNDYEFIEVMLGLVRYSTSWRNEAEEELREIYDHLNELHIMEELDPEEKTYLKKQRQKWGWLPKGMRDFMVGYDTDGKNLDGK